jgi:hypothetical protein
MRPLQDRRSSLLPSTRREGAITDLRVPWDKRLEVVGFVTEMDHNEVEEDEKEWACGVVAKNPYPDRESAPVGGRLKSVTPSGIVCSLRHWHPVMSPLCVSPLEVRMDENLRSVCRLPIGRLG